MVNTGVVVTITGDESIAKVEAIVRQMEQMRADLANPQTKAECALREYAERCMPERVRGKRPLPLDEIMAHILEGLESSAVSVYGARC